MAYMGNLKAGDRVKVTFEADVTYGSSFGVDLGVGNGRVTIREESFPGVEFEKIEPPVEVFKPGDVVRAKGSTYVYAVMRDGAYTYLGGTEPSLYGKVFHDYPGGFTSRHFERVDFDSPTR